MQKQQIAAIYCRLSKEDLDKAHKGDDSESIQNQKLLLVDYAVSNGFLVHNVYVDEDLSGFSDRPAFKQMIKDAASGLFNTIICKSQSRFTRDMGMVERYIHGYFAEWGIRFISLTDGVDTNVKGNKKARQIYGLINEWYSEDLSENIKTVFRKKMEAGQFV
ncbi:MAG: recombinase family protein, partial [Defluviitaleaceae bacterium]|nr:recombinase family protein [Defluviitaleaceae bacterium]